MKKYFIILLAVAVCLVVFAAWPRNSDRKIDKLYERCSQVEIGMTYDQVLEIMGEPVRRHYVNRDTITEEYWNYPTSPAASTLIRCDFDSSTHKVIRVLCGEH